MNRKAATGLVLNALVLGIFIWAVEHYWGWSRLLKPWHELALGTVLLAIAGMLASYALRALRIYLAERDIPRGRYWDCLRLILINNVVNLLLPARTGEASFPILMRQWFGIDAARATGTLIWLRLLDLHVLATVGGVCAISGLVAAGDGLSTLAALSAVAAALGPPVLFALRPPLSGMLSGRDGRMARLATRMVSGVPGRIATLGLDLSLTWAAWAVKLGALAAVLSKLAAIPLTLAMLGAIGGDLSTVLPIHAPGGFGTYEIGALALLSPGATPGRTGPFLAAVVNLHLLVLTTALLSGALAWLAGTRFRRSSAG
jgi:hypothetical protein